MRKKDFTALAMELGDHLSAATHAFFESKGMAFDEEAYWHQAMVDRTTVANEMLFFGVNVFPMRPDNDDEFVAVAAE